MIIMYPNKFILRYRDNTVRVIYDSSMMTQRRHRLGPKISDKINADLSLALLRCQSG